MSLADCFKFKPTGNALANLQRHLPTGIAWDAYRIPGKRFYKLFSAFASLFNLMSEALCNLVAELNPFTTDQMIGEWERAVSLPDPCLPKAITLEERRSWVVWRLSKRRWTTAQDWKDLASLFGLEIQITPGWYVQQPQLFEYRFPMGFDRFPKLGRFRVYIDVIGADFAGFEYGAPGVNANVGFPIPFGSTDDKLNELMCIIDRIRPANVVVIWNEFPATDERSCARRTFDPTLFGPPFC